MDAIQVIADELAKAQEAQNGEDWEKPPPATGKGIDANSSREERAAFRAKVQETDAKWRAEAEVVWSTDKIERAIWHRIYGTYKDMMCFEGTHEFPNSRPLDEQWSLDLELWNLALCGIRGHTYGGH